MKAKEKGYYEKNSLVELQWNMYKTAINFENPDIKKIKRIGEILLNPGDPEVDELLDQIGFKDIGKEIVEFCEKN